MTGAKEIRLKIASIKSTQKITRAMEMVAASKMLKTQNRMRASRPYASKIEAVIKHLARASSEYHHDFLTTRATKSIGLIVVTSERGLCGGLNINLLREVTRHMQQWQQEGKTIHLGIIGRKGQIFFKRVGGHIIACIDQLGDAPGINSLIGIVKIMLDAFFAKEIDALHIAYNQFISTMTQQPMIKQLLPLPKTDDKQIGHHWDYIYEPEAKELLDCLFKRYMEMQTYQAVLENIACEQAAKMVAMKNATENAGEIIKDFQLAYNKARQAAITQELAEIVGGASAL